MVVLQLKDRTRYHPYSAATELLRVKVTLDNAGALYKVAWKIKPQIPEFSLFSLLTPNESHSSAHEINTESILSSTIR